MYGGVCCGVTQHDPAKEESPGTGPSVRMSIWPYLVISTSLTREEAAMKTQFSSPEDTTKELSKAWYERHSHPVK